MAENFFFKQWDSKKLLCYWKKYLLPLIVSFFVKTKMNQSIHDKVNLCKVQWDVKLICSLIQRNGYTFTTVYSIKCVTNFLNQTLGWLMSCCYLAVRNNFDTENPFNYAQDAITVPKNSYHFWADLVHKWSPKAQLRPNRGFIKPFDMKLVVLCTICC